MSANIPNNIRALLSKYIFDIDPDSITEDLTCTLCGRLMNDAHQTSCRCKYCYGCINKYITEGNKYCRGGKEVCKEDKLILNDNVTRCPSLNKMILKAKVRCPNRPCMFTSTLALMDNHLMMCEYGPEENEFLSVRGESEAEFYDRLVSTLDEPVLVEFIKKSRLEHSAMKSDLQKSRSEIASLKEELRLNEATRGEMLKQVEAEKKLRMEQKEELIKLIDRQKQEFVKELEEVKRDVKELKNKSSGMAGATTWEDRLPIDDYINVGPREMVAVGRLSFIVDKLSERIKKEGGALFSPHLYSHTNGYKLRLRVIPGGDEYGMGTHLSVYLVVCKGEYDDMLPWPFMGAVSMSIINRRTSEPYMTLIISYSNVYKDKFTKPINKDNLPRGFPSFISHTDLSSVDGIIRDDSIQLIVAMCPPSVDVVSFTVNKFSARRAKDEIVYSPYFYSHTGGYKLRLKVHPRGWNEGKGTHLSVCLVLCKGKNDEKLPWPCRYVITFGVLNQLTKEMYKTLSITYCSCYENYFKKPTSTDNDPIGLYTFVSHKVLDSTKGLVDNDSIVLNVSVSAPL